MLHHIKMGAAKRLEKRAAKLLELEEKATTASAKRMYRSMRADLSVKMQQLAAA